MRAGSSSRRVCDEVPCSSEASELSEAVPACNGAPNSGKVREVRRGRGGALDHAEMSQLSCRQHGAQWVHGRRGPGNNRGPVTQTQAWGRAKLTQHAKGPMKLKNSSVSTPIFERDNGAPLAAPWLRRSGVMISTMHLNVRAADVMKHFARFPRPPVAPASSRETGHPIARSSRGPV